MESILKRLMSAYLETFLYQKFFENHAYFFVHHQNPALVMGRTLFFFDLVILRCFYRPLKSLWAFFLFWYNFWKWKLVFLFSILCLSCRGVCLLPSKKVNSRGCVSYLQMTLFSIEKSIVNQCFKIWGGLNFFSLFDGIG